MMRRGGSDLRPPAICRPDLGWEEPAERRLPKDGDLSALWRPTSRRAITLTHSTP